MRRDCHLGRARHLGTAGFAAAEAAEAAEAEATPPNRIGSQRLAVARGQALAPIRAFRPLHEPVPLPVVDPGTAAQPPPQRRIESGGSEMGGKRNGCFRVLEDR